MPTCTKCLLDDTIPGVRVDAQGICQYCRQAEAGQERDAQRRMELRNAFLHLIQEQAGQNEYDCLVAFSGGKDSSYTLHLMAQKYKLRPLAMTFDNWFQSSQAWENIRQVLKQISVEHVILRPGYKDFCAAVSACVEKDIFPIRTMQRASAVCTVCLAMIRSAAIKLAVEKSIPFVVFGLSPGQAPLSTAVFKMNPEMVRKMQGSIIQALEQSLSFPVHRYFLQESHFQCKDRFPYSINPLAFEDYDEQAMFEVLSRYGWQTPEDTDANSSNCLLNSLANQAHEQRYGFNPYLFELSELVRSGTMDRQEALERLNRPLDQDLVHRVRQEIGGR